MNIVKIGQTIIQKASKAVRTESSCVAKVSKAVFKGSKKCPTTDTFELCAAATRWAKPAEEYIPQIIKGAEGFAIPMHHDLNGSNIIIRETLKDIAKNSLTKKEQDFLDLTLKEVYYTDKAFKKLLPLEKDCIAYRGRHKSIYDSPHLVEDFSIIAKAKTGDVIVPDMAYSYCAFDSYTASKFLASNGKGNESILYTIRIPKGAKVSRNLEHGGEVVMPRGSQYKVVSKDVKGNFTEVTLEYILPKQDNLVETEKLMKKFGIPISE